MLAMLAPWADPVRGQDRDALPADPTTEAPPELEQDSDSMPGVPAHIRGAADRIQYVGPDTYILLDAEGRPQPVPGLTYEDFLAVWKQLQTPAESSREPRYTIDRIQVDGVARDGRAELTFTATVQLLTDEGVDVPLGLVGSILRQEPKFGDSAPGDTDSEPNTATNQSRSITPRHEYLYFNPDRGGYVSRLQGRAGERRTVSLELIVPLLRNGEETTLPLNLPRASTSNLELSLNKPVSGVNVSSGTVLEQSKSSEGGTKLKVAGAIGPFRLSWLMGDSSQNTLGAVLNAEGAVRVTIDGRSVRSDARLTVQSYGGSFDRFRVRLPRGAQLVQDVPAAAEAPAPDYRVTIESQSSVTKAARDSTPGGQIALVEFKEKKQGPVTVNLSTEQPVGLNDSESVVEIGGFEVLGAVRQFGDIALEVAEDWQARWEIGDYVRQVDPSDINTSLQHAGLVASFQYDRQPWSLSVGISPRRIRVHATPRYELEYFSDEVRLNVRVAYQVFGARAFEFRVRMKGWELAEDAIESGGLVNQDRVLVTPDDELVLPLSQSSSRRSEVAFSARRKIARNIERLELPLPVPIADSVGTGEVIVRSGAAVQILPNLADSVGLTAARLNMNAETESGVLGGEQSYNTSLPEAIIVAERVSRARQVSAEASTRVEIRQDDAQIDRRITYSVQYEPIDELSLNVPRGLQLDEQSTAITLIPAVDGGESTESEREIPLAFESTNGAPQTASPEPRQLHVVLPQPRLGQFAVRIRYRIPRPVGPLTNGAWRLPLIQQADGEATKDHVVVRAPRSIGVALETKTEGLSWKVAASPPDSGANGPSYMFSADDSEGFLPLVLRSITASLPSETTVERAWLQTWLSGEIRQDRAAFRFRTTGSQAAIELPPQAAADEVEVLLDGRPAVAQSSGLGRIVVQLLGSGATNNDQIASIAREHTIELRYRQASRRGLLTRYRLTPPQIVGTTALSELYWQIVLPGDQQVVHSPARMTSAGEWQWLGSFWGRRPLLSQADLEKWAGASQQLAPAAGENEYIFTGLAPVASIELVTAPRWLIVLVASSVTLAVVLLWLYLPFAQRSWIVLVLAGIVAAAAAAFPEPALLLAQASVVGVVLAMLSMLIARTAARPARWPITLSTGSSQRHTTARTDSIMMPPMTAAASTAPTAPLISPDA